MYRIFIGAAFGLVLFCNAAMATCPAPVMFSNGQTADASVVYNDIKSITDCLNASTVTLTGILGVQSGSTTQLLLNNTAASPNKGNNIVFQQGGSNAWVLGQQAGDNSGNFNLFSYGYGNVALSVNYTSGVVSCLVSCSSGSDQRIKRNIQRLDPGEGLIAIRRLEPVSFNWATGDTSTPQIGFVAQEVKKIFPQLITNSGFKSENTPDGMLAMNYGSLTAPIVLALQQLDARTTALEVASHSVSMKSLDGARDDSVSDIIGKLKAANDNQAVEIERLEAKVIALERKIQVQTAQK